jgi:hypothetical protein
VCARWAPAEPHPQISLLSSISVPQWSYLTKFSALPIRNPRPLCPFCPPPRCPFAGRVRANRRVSACLPIVLCPVIPSPSSSFRHLQYFSWMWYRSAVGERWRDSQPASRRTPWLPLTLSTPPHSPPSSSSSSSSSSSFSSASSASFFLYFGSNVLGPNKSGTSQSLFPCSQLTHFFLSESLSL